jgi:ABC-type transport system substrate-binding protein
MISGFSVEKINEILKRAYSEINQDKLKEIYNESTLH